MDGDGMGRELLAVDAGTKISSFIGTLGDVTQCILYLEVRPREMTGLDENIKAGIARYNHLWFFNVSSIFFCFQEGIIFFFPHFNPYYHPYYNPKTPNQHSIHPIKLAKNQMKKKLNSRKKIKIMKG